MVQRPRPPPPGDRRRRSRPARAGRALDDARAHPSRRRRARRPGWSRSRRRGSTASSTPSPARPRSRSRSRWRSSTGASAGVSSGPSSSPSPAPTTATRSARSRSAGSTSSTAPTARCCSRPARSTPGDVRRLERVLELHAREIGAVIVEPLVQGAAGIRVQPPGFLRAVRELCSAHDVLMIADEVATGFGRTGTMFACEQERVAPDFLCLGKGLTAGYLPLAATMTTERVYEGFLGAHEDYRTFFHGHTYTGNPLACAAARRQPRGLPHRADDAAPAAEDQDAERAAHGRRGDGRGRRGAGARLHGRDRPRRARPGAAARPPGRRSRRERAARSSARSATPSS